ncbi:hypothetical protein BD309DRAFT_973927 [Dichomitus squalens]|nr:hypothetical protein BD309DRAFT_973927 [Dichomitus squalens]
MASLALAGPPRPLRTLNAGMHGTGSGTRKTRRMSVVRQPRSHTRRELCDRLPATRFRRAYVSAPVHRASQHSRHRQALLPPTVHRSTTPRLSYGASSSAGPPARAAVVSAPPSLAMSVTVTAMAYTPSPQASTPTASTSPLVIRRGRSATPLFLHRTPTYHPHPRSSASMSQLAQPRPPNASMSQLAPNRVPPSTFNRASAPPTSSRGASESMRIRMAERSSSSTEVKHIPKLRAAMDHSAPPSALSRPSTGHCIRPPPTDDCVQPSRASPTPSTSVSASPSPSPLPSLLSSPALVDKDLPPVPSPTEPPTPSEEALDPVFRFPPLPRPSRIPSLRPLSFDAEATIRELEELAASIMSQDTTREAETLAASFKAYGLPTIEINLWRDNEMPAAIPEESSPITPRPLMFTRKDVPFAASPGDSFQSNASLSVPHIVVTDPSTEDLSEQLHRSLPALVSPGGKTEAGQGDDEEELQWVCDYGAWGMSDKGKWRASVGEEESSDHDLSPKSKNTPLPRASIDNTYIYEPMGAPEFLVGSSTSPVVRAMTGYRSHIRPSKRAATEAFRARRRRAAPLALANPAQAEWELETTLANALFLGTSKPPRRPQTAPNTARPRQPTPPSTWLHLKRSMPSTAGADGPPPGRAEDPGVVLHTSTGEGESNRRSDPIPVIPHTLFPSAMFSTHDLHPLRFQEGDRTSQGVPWPSIPAGSGGSGTGSEPSTPRPSGRPRLKSLKGLFKHWSK